MHQTVLALGVTRKSKTVVMEERKKSQKEVSLIFDYFFIYIVAREGNSSRVTPVPDNVPGKKSKGELSTGNM